MSSYGQTELSVLDRFGVYLSQAPIRQVIGGYRNPDVLDIGCGFEASLLRHLRPSIGSGVGIDSAVSEAAKSVPGLRFVEEPAERGLPAIADSSFDVVLMVSVLEHLWEPLDALRECRRLLKPLGSLVLNVPNWLGKEALELVSFKLKVGSANTAESIDDHKTYYDKRDLWPLVVRAGFKPSQIRMRYHKFGLNLFAVARKTDS
jgi:SAM-dependent methyltransferase